MKILSKKKIVMICSFIVLAIFFSALFFYFYPVPITVQIAARNRPIKRCFYTGGIGYFAIGTLSATSVFYNIGGENLCETGGHGIVNIKPEGPCAQNICFPIYDN